MIPICSWFLQLPPSVLFVADQYNVQEPSSDAGITAFHSFHQFSGLLPNHSDSRHPSSVLTVEIELREIEHYDNRLDLSWPALTCLDLHWPVLTCLDLPWPVLTCLHLSWPLILRISTHLRLSDDPCSWNLVSFSSRSRSRTLSRLRHAGEVLLDDYVMLYDVMMSWCHDVWCHDG